MKEKWLRIGRYLGVFVVGGLVGAGLNFWFVTWPLVQMQVGDAVERSDKEAYVTYRYGSFPAARRAILEHARLAEALARSWPDATRGKGTPVDLILWFGRLSLAAERAGQAEEARGFFQQALQKARVEFRNVTEADVRAEVLKQDAEWDAKLQSTRSSP